VSAHRLAQSLTGAGSWVAGACLAGIACVCALQVFCRYVLNAPLRWPEELSRILLVWLTYAGALVLPELGLHVAVGVLHERLAPRWRLAADVLADMLAVIFFGVLVVAGLSLMRSMVDIRLPALQLPLNLLFAVIPVTGALQVYVHAVAAVRRIRGVET
jgi:TRAP-type C4-dicarboxylate transport system permease small subunit